VTSTLNIRRLACTYLAPHDHPTPHNLRAEMDELARKYVASACGRALGGMLDPNDPSVWVISSLNVDLLLDLHGAVADNVADFWGQKLALSVAKTIYRGDDGIHVLRFSNRAAYLAYLLRELANSTAWDKWYFNEFDGLRPLPPGPAIREVFLREPEHADAALQELSTSKSLARVIGALSALDQEMIVSYAFGPMLHDDRALKEAISLLPTHTPSGDYGALQIYLHLRHRMPELAPAIHASASLDASRLLRWLKVGGRPEVFEILFSRKIPGFEIHSRELASLERMRDLAIVSPAFRAALTLAVRPSADLANDVRTFSSEAGAVFLLLPVMLRPPALAELFAAPHRAVERYLLLSLCFAPHLHDSWRDPAIRLAAGLNDLPDERAVRACVPPSSAALNEFVRSDDLAHFQQKALTLHPSLEEDSRLHRTLAIAAAVLVRSFTSYLPGLGTSSLGYLWRNVLSGASRITATPKNIEVQLASRPLQIVIRMATSSVSQFTVPWNEELTIIVKFDS